MSGKGKSFAELSSLQKRRRLDIIRQNINCVEDPENSNEEDANEEWIQGVVDIYVDHDTDGDNGVNTGAENDIVDENSDDDNESLSSYEENDVDFEDLEVPDEQARITDTSYSDDEYI